MKIAIKMIIAFSFIVSACGQQETSILVEEVPEGDSNALKNSQSDALGKNNDMLGQSGTSQSSDSSLNTANFDSNTATSTNDDEESLPETETETETIVEEVVVEEVVVEDPEPITIAITSESVNYAVSQTPYAYEVGVTSNDTAGYTLELVSGPAGFALNGNTLTGMYSNPETSEWTTHAVQLKATSVTDTSKTATQTFNLRIDSVCQDSIINLVSMIQTDANGAEVKTPLGSFAAYSGDISAAANYNFYSASAHPINGPTPMGFYGSTFMYIDPAGNSYLNLFWGMDAGGSADTIVNVDVTTTGNMGMDSVVLSDDGGEMIKTGSSADQGNYEGRFHYWSNTDGAVIGPFSGTDYKITVKMLEGGDNTNAKFYSQDGNDLTLIDNGSLVSYEITFSSVRMCQ